ncbi:PLP-dependent aminotransferase family protein [Paenibacillaceae bacterium WGS1546]|uniref:MocR-like pyridoxine biosynthesis transcription factor PdxR n=1 Tax=Cohnella sp. WGS1546 TaxID=3366810 RepID=UPI00372D104A
MTWTDIDRAADTPLFRQIYESFRKRILQGELGSGEKLPGTRELASDLRVSRTVVVEAYEQLMAEGYIEGRHGSGTYVAEGTSLHPLPEKPLRETSKPASPRTDRGVADRIDFRHGIPSLELFPRKTWGELAKRISADVSAEAFGYGKPEGRTELRDALSRYLRRSRGVVCEPDQLIVTTGATQAISLIARLLLSGTSDVVIEDPLTKEIHEMFSLPGTRVHAIPADDQGIATRLLPPRLKPRFIYVTPSHQFPLGGVLPVQRRVQLIRYASLNGSYIVEDDYDSEFRYDCAPVSSLQGLDPDRVIYIGTFSKILSPALRMGYLILPRSLVEEARNLKWLTDLHTPSLEQLILAEFIERGHLERHVSRMRKAYRRRRDCLVRQLNEAFGSSVKVFGQSTGIHLVAEFPGIPFTPERLSRIESSGVKVYPVSAHSRYGDDHRERIILGYGNLTEERIAAGIRRLAAALSPETYAASPATG